MKVKKTYRMHEELISSVQEYARREELSESVAVRLLLKAGLEAKQEESLEKYCRAAAEAMGVSPEEVRESISFLAPEK